MASIGLLWFEHYRQPSVLGAQEARPRLSWYIATAVPRFTQAGYELELSVATPSAKGDVLTFVCDSPFSKLIPWPLDLPLTSRQKVTARVRVWGIDAIRGPWSPSAYLEAGLLDRSDWQCTRIGSPSLQDSSLPGPEHLFRKTFYITNPVKQARLYITAEGVYEAEINGHRVGDHFMAPGWTTYDGRLQYQCFDLTDSLNIGPNCLGARVAEGWFCGRLGFEGGKRNIWGSGVSLLAQIEVTSTDNITKIILTDGSWQVKTGPIRLAEIYDGEKYDATMEDSTWSLPMEDGQQGVTEDDWINASVLGPLSSKTKLITGYSEPVRRIESLRPLEKITTPSGLTVIDFGQNLVGYVRLSNIRGARGQKVTLSHAEVLENGELGTRPLRICQATDEYTLKGLEGEKYEPRFTFHGFRYCQIQGVTLDLDDIEAVVCHTDMRPTGDFSCSNDLVNQLHRNIVWGMRGNFLSVPTDCPQRDERLGWSGDLSVFAPTATLLFDCFGILKNWLVDARYDQDILGGVPSMVSPNSMLPDPRWLRRIPCAIWHDVVVLVPWALYEETGDEQILEDSFKSMMAWLEVIPRPKTGNTNLWDPSVYQLADWLDPSAPPDKPWKSTTDSKMVANMFLVRTLNIVVRVATIIGRTTELPALQEWAVLAQNEFQREYITGSGRIVSDTQTAYALAICFDILDETQRVRAGERLAELVRKNQFKIATGFAGTPFVCEALAQTGHSQVALAVLLCCDCPSWLYPVTMGATTVWERWDSMLPDGTVNPGEMTSFNHYALGAIAKFLYERVAGLQRVNAGWTTIRVAPIISDAFSHASAHHVTPQGKVECSWKTNRGRGDARSISLSVTIPYGSTATVVIPDGKVERREEVGPGTWSFSADFEQVSIWPVPPLNPKS